MTYQEKSISKNQLEKVLQTLDLDEGVRIENKSDMIFINRSAKRYCVNISIPGDEKFFYYSELQDVLNFLNEKLDSASKIFSY